jgi:hypothetical protein
MVSCRASSARYLAYPCNNATEEIKRETFGKLEA